MKHSKAAYWGIIFTAILLSAAGGFFTARYSVDSAFALTSSVNSPLKELKKAGGEVTGSTRAPRDLRYVMFNVVQGALTLIGTFLLIMILYAGYLWWSAGGNEDQVTKAKSTLRNAVIGMIIIGMSYSLLTFVFNSVFVPNTPNLRDRVDKADQDAQSAQDNQLMDIPPPSDQMAA